MLMHDAALIKDVVTTQIQLIEAQQKIEEQAVQMNWPGGPHRFTGSLGQTLTDLILLGENTVADKLKDKFEMSEKAYWKIKVKALAKSRQFDELSAFATNRSAAGGYGVVVQCFLDGERPDLAMKFVPKVKSHEEQARYYTALGMHEQARLAMQRAEEQPGPQAMFANMGRQFENNFGNLPGGLGNLFGGGS